MDRKKQMKYVCIHREKEKRVRESVSVSVSVPIDNKGKNAY